MNVPITWGCAALPPQMWEDDHGAEPPFDHTSTNVRFRTYSDLPKMGTRRDEQNPSAKSTSRAISQYSSKGLPY